MTNDSERAGSWRRSLAARADVMVLGRRRRQCWERALAARVTTAIVPYVAGAGDCACVGHDARLDACERKIDSIWNLMDMVCDELRVDTAQVTATAPMLTLVQAPRQWPPMPPEGTDQGVRGTLVD
jgi:hypothetical protein